MPEKVKETIAFDFRTIKSFDDACKKVGINTESLPLLEELPEEFRKSVLAAYKLMVIFKAINDGWIPDWSNRNQYKYFPWFAVSQSCSCFSGLDYDFLFARTIVGSRLSTDSSEKALYIAETFEQEYKDFMLYAE